MSESASVGGEELGQRVIRKVSRRLLPFMGRLFFINYLDRTNIGFGKLTMSKDLGLSDTMFGLAMFLAAILVLLLRGAPRPDHVDQPYPDIDQPHLEVDHLV
jgi:MFS transporter, ACS family, tartrate transporter